jgi:hypothetical protein
VPFKGGEAGNTRFFGKILPNGVEIFSKTEGSTFYFQSPLPYLCTCTITVDAKRKDHVEERKSERQMKIEYFKRTIQAYLEERAMEDELFAAKYDNPDKNIDDCVTYILNWVQKSGCNGFCDDEIYGQAIHYYEEKDIEVGKPLNCQVSVNHHIELTEEEKAQARQEAIRQYQQEQMNKMRNRDTAKRTSQRTETEVHQPSLFDTL